MTANNDMERTAEERWQAYYERLMSALRSEDMQGAAQQAALVSSAVEEYLAAAPTAEGRTARIERVFHELEAARRSAVTTREFLRVQAKTVKPTTAYSLHPEEERERWSTRL